MALHSSSFYTSPVIESMFTGGGGNLRRQDHDVKRLICLTFHMNDKIIHEMYKSPPLNSPPDSVKAFLTNILLQYGDLQDFFKNGGQ